MFGFYRANGRKNAPAIITVPSTASTSYHVGDALVLTSGAATKAGATVKPTHICAQEYVAPASGNQPIAVYPVLDGYEWITTFAAAPTGIVAGSKVTLHTDSAQVTATTASGVAEVVDMYGATASGDEVIVKF